MREYECKNCGRTVDKLLSLKDKTTAISCSVCGSKDMIVTTTEIKDKKIAKGMGARSEKD